MNKRTLIRALLSIGLIAYLAVALTFTHSTRAEANCAGFDIAVIDSSSCRFVTAAGIDQELGGIRAKAASMKLRDIDTDQIERRLDLIDDIEETVCVCQSDDRVKLLVTPMKPVARIYNPDGTSYYVNKDGKQMKASLRYRTDVPLILNESGSTLDAVSLLPMLRHINNDSLWKSLVTAVKVDRRGDILLIPAIRGHVINLGDTAMLADKLNRTLTIYRKVLPLKGWDTYDTLSVKWRGQVVATHRNKAKADDPLKGEEILDEETDDVDNMIADSTAVKLSNKLS